MMRPSAAAACFVALAATTFAAVPAASAADFDRPRSQAVGSHAVRRYGPPPVALIPSPPPYGCRPAAVIFPRTPTNAPDDPSYVGSSFGLGKPSYYGTVPPLGVDDPYGRRPRPC